MPFSKRSFVALGLWITACVSSPTRLLSRSEGNLLTSRSIENGIALRIQPLGDSITYGYLSSDNNGYRATLLSLLAGNTVQYVGSVRAGNMEDNYNEGHPGAIIDQIATFAKLSLPERPNVVLLMAGTNDVNNNDDVGGAPDRLGSLIDEVIAACPDAVVVVAQITPILNAASEARRETYNAAIPAVVKTRTDAGKHVLIVDMGTCVSVNDLKDGLHPTDLGYQLMANCWLKGIQQAGTNNWITAPVKANVPTDGAGTCTGSLYWDPEYGIIASGIGSADKAFSAGWVPAGELASGGIGTGKLQGSGVRLADINGDGKDDYLWVDPVTGATTYYENGGYSPGKVIWYPEGELATGLGDGPGVIFADITGDGLADYIWVAVNGDVHAARNGGPNPNGGWIWYPLGVILTGYGGSRASTQFADLDGDGRAEYILVGENGALEAWLNTGGDTPTFESMGTIASGIGDQAGVHITDLNGDGRADYVWLDKDGALTAYINQRGQASGLSPIWIPLGVIATGVGTSRDNITFGDINGDGKKDYVFVNATSGALNVWMNEGSGDTYVVGDGTRFADMNNDGRDDYLAVGIDGSVELYLNGGYDSSTKNWIWEPQGTIASGVGARKDLRFADLDGDGAADYLVVDEKTGAVDFWRNGGNSASGWIWTNQGSVASGIGVGAGVQFADLNNDKRADYLWVDTDGAVTAYLNGGENSAAAGGFIWEPQGVIASGVGASRADVQFHDINGDGQADYIWVDRLTGSVQVWLNGGANPAGGWIWYPQGEVATGVGSNGLSVQFADTTGDGRSDYLVVMPSSGAVTEWFNGCSSSSGGTTPTPPKSTPTPQPQPDKPGWQAATCTDVGVTNAALDQNVRWNDEDTTDAWNAAVDNWNTIGNAGGLSFAETISNFFHGPEQLQCGVTADHNGCSNPIECVDTDFPAGYFIINSFVALNNMNLNIYDAITRVEADMTATIGSFSSTFAPIVDKDTVAKILLDIGGLAFALGMSPDFGYFAKSATNPGNPNQLGTLKDEVNPLVSNGVTLIKDGDLSSAQVNAENTLALNLANMITVWYNTIDNINDNIFNGQLGSVNQLGDLMTDGQLLEPGNTLDDASIQTALEFALYGTLIPQAWSLSNEGITPFILDSQAPCSESNPASAYISQNTADLTWTCIDNTLYYLVSASGAGQTCVNEGNTGTSTCTPRKFSIPPGLVQLDSGDWGGLTHNDLIISAVAGYNANNQQNGWSQADPTDENTLSSLYDNGFHAPGVVQIPVCTGAIAEANWLNGGNVAHEPNFPCNTPATPPA